MWREGKKDGKAGFLVSDLSNWMVSGSIYWKITRGWVGLEVKIMNFGGACWTLKESVTPLVSFITASPSKSKLS